MTTVPVLDGVITGREIGPGLMLDGEEVAGRVVVRVKAGRNLYLTPDGTLHATQLADKLDWWDWLFLAWGCGVAVLVGFLIGRFAGRWNEAWAWGALALVAVFAAGWVAAYLWRHPARPRYPGR